MFDFVGFFVRCGLFGHLGLVTLFEHFSFGAREGEADQDEGYEREHGGEQQDDQRSADAAPEVGLAIGRKVELRRGGGGGEEIRIKVQGRGKRKSASGGL